MKKKFLLLLSISILSVYSYAQSEATYSVTFTSNWTQMAHPHSSGNLPSGAHWTKLVGATHNDQVVFVEMGGLASPGVEDIAELGNNTIFFSEVNSAIALNYANFIIDGDDLPTAEGQIVINDIVTTEDYPLLTLLSMIAPSPDWMIAMNSVSLLDTNGDWIDEIIIDLYPYDAGTDSGVDYTSPNMNTDPQEPITSKQGMTPFSNEIIGSITITLEGVILGVDDITLNETILFPNPTDKTVTISSSNSVQAVSIYNALGAEVLTLNDVRSNSKQIDLSHFSSGIYLVKVRDISNNISVKRLVKF
jgi:Spondin_N/Secretion system C-terminal sorting domain